MPAYNFTERKITVGSGVIILVPIPRHHVRKQSGSRVVGHWNFDQEASHGYIAHNQRDILLLTLDNF